LKPVSTQVHAALTDRAALPPSISSSLPRLLSVFAFSPIVADEEPSEIASPSWIRAVEFLFFCVFILNRSVGQGLFLFLVFLNTSIVFWPPKIISPCLRSDMEDYIFSPRTGF